MSNKHQQAKPAPGVVTSDTVHGGRGKRMGLPVILLAVVIVLAGAGAGLYSALKNKPQPPHNTAPSAADDALAHPAQAVASAQTALQQATNPAEKAAAYTQLGTAYLNNSQAGKAVDAYNGALATNQADTISTLAALSNAYIADGQSQQAADALQKLVTALQHSSDASLRSQIPKYQGAITQLRQGSPL